MAGPARMRSHFISEVRPPLSLTDNWTKNEEIREYFKRELVENGSNAAYLDKNTNDNLIKYFENNSIKKKGQMVKKSTENKRKIDWLGISIATLKGIPQIGQLAFGGREKYHNDKIEDKRFNEINEKIDLIIEDDAKVTLEKIQELFLKHFAEQEALMISRASQEVVNIIQAESDNGNELPSETFILNKLTFSALFPNINMNDFKKEMKTHLGTNDTINDFRNAIRSSEFKLHSPANADPEQEVLIFCNKLDSVPLSDLKIIFEALAEKNQQAEIINIIHSSLKDIKN